MSWNAVPGLLRDVSKCGAYGNAFTVFYHMHQSFVVESDGAVDVGIMKGNEPNVFADQVG